MKEMVSNDSVRIGFTPLLQSIEPVYLVFAGNLNHFSLFSIRTFLCSSSMMSEGVFPALGRFHGVFDSAFKGGNKPNQCL